MMAERLDRGNFDKCKGSLKDIEEDIGELDILIGRILELSKLDIHELALKRESLSPATLLEELLEKKDPLIVYKNLSIQKDLPAIPPMTGDRVALEMAFSNIIDNALKFSPKSGTVRIDLSKNNSFLTIRITNTYDKVPEPDLKKIFEPFYRSGQSTSSGTGLGLSIAAKIIRKHGGASMPSTCRTGLKSV
jgi:two-component system sensor histidine kinase CpxA